jgi:hypothetical protein
VRDSEKLTIKLQKMNNKSTNISEPLQPALGMSLCCTLADATHETTNEEEKIKNAKRGDI